MKARGERKQNETLTAKQSILIYLTVLCAKQSQQSIKILLRNPGLSHVKTGSH